jgi:hypothetical protein
MQQAYQASNPQQMQMGKQLFPQQQPGSQMVNNMTQQQRNPSYLGGR